MNVNLKTINTNRRAFLKNVATGLGTLGIASSPLINMEQLHAQPKKPNFLEELGFEAAAKIIPDYNFDHPAHPYIQLPDMNVAKKILEGINNIDEWYQRIITAPVRRLRDFAYVTDIGSFANLVAKANDKNFEIKKGAYHNDQVRYWAISKLRNSKTKFSEAELISFGKEIKSGRLASIIVGASIVDMPRRRLTQEKLDEIAKTINRLLNIQGYHTKDLSIEELSKKYNLKDGYFDKEYQAAFDNYRLIQLRYRQEIEDSILEIIYGKDNTQKLIRAFKNTNDKFMGEVYPDDGIALFRFIEMMMKEDK